MVFWCRDIGEEFEGSSGRGEYANRSTLLFTVAALLKRYADEYQLLVVVSNQVSAAFSTSQDIASNLDVIL